MKNSNILRKPILSTILLSCVIVSIPFLEFIKTNFFQIDRVVYSQLLLYIFFVIVIFFILLFFFLFLVKDVSKTKSLIITTSSTFWFLFKFDFLKTKFSFLSESYGKNFIIWEISAAGLLIILFAIFCYFFLINKKINIFFYKFIYFFFLFQAFFLLIFIFSFTINDKMNFISTENEKSLNNYFTPNEIKKINLNQKKENIYFIIMDGMTSLKEYEVLLKKSTTSNKSDTKIDEKIKRLKKFYFNNNFNYIENSFSTFKDTHHTFGSILNLSPLQLNGIDKNSFKYQNNLYPASLSKNNFEIGNFPQLVKTLNKIGYDFKWLGYKLNCKFINPNLCFDYMETRPTRDNKFIINFYILKSFLANTPAIDLYKLARTNLNIKIKLPDREIMQDENIYNSNFEVISEFVENANKYQKKNRSYFYLLHNILPKLDDYFFQKDCAIKTIGLINEFTDLDLYLDNYECALKKINSLIDYINNHDSNAVVVIQADHGHYFSDKNSDDHYKIFNLIKVPNYCKSYLSNEIDNINGVRLSLSCATNSNIKLLKRKIYDENKFLN